MMHGQKNIKFSRIFRRAINNDVRYDVSANQWR